MKIQMIQVPYDSGYESLRTGRGPDHFMQRGIDRILRDGGHQVDSYRITLPTSWKAEIETTFELDRLLAEQVGSAIADNKFPLVLAGACNSCVGTLAGTGQDSLGVVWLDAHGDFNTPETTMTGMLDGMGLAMAAGRCWRSLLRTIPGFQPVAEANIVHIGARDLDPEEEQLLRQSEIDVIRPAAGGSNILRAVDTAFNKLRNKITRVYLHVDLDVLDTGEALPNHLAVPGGLSVEVVEEIVQMVKERFEVCAGAIASFDPDYDQGDKVLGAGIRIMKAFVA